MKKQQLSTEFTTAIEQAVVKAMNSNTPNANQHFYYLPLDETLKEVGCRSAQTLYSWIRQNTFPKPYRLVSGGRAVAWRSNEIEEFKQSRKHAEVA